MQRVKIIRVVSSKLAPMYATRGNDDTPCPVYISLNSSGDVHFKRSPDRGVTFDVHYGRELNWEIPPELSSAEMQAFGKKLKRLLGKVLRGFSVSLEMNSGERHGTLTPEAEEARGKIQEACDHLFELVESHKLGVRVIEPCDYFQGDTPADYDLDADSSDEDIEREAKSLIKQLATEKTMFNGDLFAFIKDWVKN